MFNLETTSVCITLEDSDTHAHIEVTLEVEFTDERVTSISIEDPFEFDGTEYDQHEEFDASLCKFIVHNPDDIPLYDSFDDLDEYDLQLAFRSYIQTIAEI